MSPDIDNHPLWGKQSPLSGLAGLGFLIFAGGRMAFAILGSFALLWTYAATALTAKALLRVLPRFGRSAVVLFLASFYSTVFYVLLALASPVMAGEAYLHIALVPAVFMASNLWKRVESLSMDRAINRSILEALVLGSLTAASALIREPFGFGSISVPGPRGITELLGSAFAADVSIRFIASSSGALILLGYLIALFRVSRDIYLRSIHRRTAP